MLQLSLLFFVPLVHVCVAPAASVDQHTNTGFIDTHQHCQRLQGTWWLICRSTAAEFVVPKLPWLIEALGAIFLDGSIVFQIFYYRRKNRNKPPPQVPASVNPLGTIAL